MAKAQVIETFYGKYNKYEVVKEPAGILTGTKFYIHRNGKYHRGSFSSLRDAVDACRKEAERG